MNGDSAEYRVLLVDDEEDFCEVLAQRLETREMAVDIAANGEAALDAIKKKTYDAIILDMNMPGMNGIETLTAIQKVNPDLQAILLTGRATAASAVQAMKLGAVDFLEKPADIDVLVAKIQEAADKKLSLFQGRIDQQMSDILKKKGW